MITLILILAGIVLIIAAWLSALVTDGWNAPAGKFHRGPMLTALIGVACLVAGIARILT